MTEIRLEQLLGFLEKFPEDSFNLYAIALEYVRLNDTKNAERYFTKLVDNDPAFLPVYYQLGQLYSSQNKTKKALETFRQGMVVAENQKETKVLSELKQAIEFIEFDD